MDDTSAGKIHWSFWAIGVAALVWNALGSMNFIMQMNPDVVAQFPDTHQAIIIGRPVWATTGFAIGVFGGSLACVLLLLRKSAAGYLFIASLLGVIAATVHTVRIAASAVQFSNFELVMMIPMPVVVAGCLLWYSKWARDQGWTG